MENSQHSRRDFKKGRRLKLKKSLKDSHSWIFYGNFKLLYWGGQAGRLVLNSLAVSGSSWTILKCLLCQWHRTKFLFQFPTNLTLLPLSSLHYMILWVAKTGLKKTMITVLLTGMVIKYFIFVFNIFKLIPIYFIFLQKCKKKHMARRRRGSKDVKRLWWALRIFCASESNGSSGPGIL